MKEFITNGYELIKSIMTWLFALLVLGSFCLNVWFSAVFYMDREIIKENQNYMKHRDSIQLELMDRISNKNK